MWGNSTLLLSQQKVQQVWMYFFFLLFSLKHEMTPTLECVVYAERLPFVFKDHCVGTRHKREKERENKACPSKCLPISQLQASGRNECSPSTIIVICVALELIGHNCSSLASSTRISRSAMHVFETQCRSQSKKNRTQWQYLCVTFTPWLC